MKTLFDTSIIVAFCVKNHPKHSIAKKWIKKSVNGKLDGYIASHSLVEAYSVLTRAPFEPKIGPLEAQQLLERNVLSYLKLTQIDSKDYIDIIQKLSANNFTGGISYDAMILANARKYKIDQIVSANAKDFTNLLISFGWKIEVIGI